MSAAQRRDRAQRVPLRTLLSAYAVSQFGNWLFRTAVVYYAYNQHRGSNAVLTTAIVLVYLPVLFGSRLLAPLADRIDTRRALIGLDALRAATLLVLLGVVLAGLGSASAATIAVLAFLSLLTPFFAASQTAYLRRVLPAARLGPALAGVSKVDWWMFVLGTATGPLVLQVSDLPTLIVVDIATFVVSGLLLIRLVPAPVPADGRPGGTVAGGRRSRLSLSSRWLLLGVFALNAGAGLINVYPNVVARNFLGGGVTWLSVINLANGIGAVVGATLIGRLGRRYGLLPGVLAALVVSVSLVGMTFVTTAWAAVATSSAMLLAGQVFAVAFQTRILENEPVGVAGRVSGLFTLATFAGVTVSVTLFMVFTSLGPLRPAFTVVLLAGAAAALLSVLVGLTVVRRHGNDAPDQDPGQPGSDRDAFGPGRDASDLVPDVQATALLVRRSGRAFATGVAVASTVQAGTPHASTVNSFVTVSLDPPLVMICVKQGSRLESMLTEDAPLGITILSAGNRDAARYFASCDRPIGEAEFATFPWQSGRQTGAPLLTAGAGWLECRVQQVVPAGDHSIVLARVLAFTSREQPGEGPLIFFGGRYHTLDSPTVAGGPGGDTDMPEGRSPAVSPVPAGQAGARR